MLMEFVSGCVDRPRAVFVLVSIANVLASCAMMGELPTHPDESDGGTRGTATETSLPCLGIVPVEEPLGVACASPGVLLRGVLAGSPAAAAGLQREDLLVRFADRDISSLSDLYSVLREKQPGQDVQLLVLRRGEKLSKIARLGARRGATGNAALAPSCQQQPSRARDRSPLP